MASGGADNSLQRLAALLREPQPGFDEALALARELVGDR